MESEINISYCSKKIGRIVAFFLTEESKKFVKVWPENGNCP
jgi:hypothetical protein